MSTTRLSDVIVPEVFFNYMAKDTTEKTKIFQSGAIRNDPELAARLGQNQGGRTFNMPFWNDLDNTESSVASDNPAQEAVPGNITASKDICRRQIRTRSWSTTDLAGTLAGSDPMQRVQSRANSYWDRQFQRIMVATATGLFSDNIANDGNDMVNDIGSDSSAGVTAAELVSAEAIIDTAFTLGDAEDVLKIIMMHPTVAKRLKKLNLIDYIPDSEGRIRWAYYLGYLVVIDEGCRTVVGANRTKYWTYLVGPGAFGWAEVPTATPVEVDRKPGQGNGMGVEILYTRRQFVLHPYGIKFTDASVGGDFPSNAELALATNWDRVYAERKQIALAALVTNG